MTETWLSDTIFDSEILPSDYFIIHKDRSSRGGGVMLAVKNSKSFKVLSSPSTLELITVKVISCSPTIYCLVYIPPKSSDEYLQELFKTFHNIDGNFVLMGDFNFSDINWESLPAG